MLCLTNKSISVHDSIDDTDSEGRPAEDLLVSFSGSGSIGLESTLKAEAGRAVAILEAM
jgi:hypothetical protein